MYTLWEPLIFTYIAAAVIWLQLYSHEHRKGYSKSGYWPCVAEVANGHQNLHASLLPGITASWHTPASFAVKCGQMTELKPVEIGTNDMCHFQAWPIKPSRRYCSLPFFLWPRKRWWEQWLWKPQSETEEPGSFSMDITPWLDNNMTANVQPLPGFLGRSSKRSRMFWSHRPSCWAFFIDGLCQSDLQCLWAFFLAPWMLLYHHWQSS